jgi:NAD(P)-dependent dehydrogenase (short-subunit alcohol dehydrogenase family)
MMLNGKKILIVGAAGLLGGEVVKGLLNSGAHVIATDISIDAMGERFSKLDIDYDDEVLTLHQLNILCEQSVKEFFQSLDVLDGAVNAVYPRNSNYGAPFFDVNLADFNDNVNLQLGAMFLFSQQCAAFFMRTKKPFSLVNFSSIYGVVAPDFDIYNNTQMTMPVEYAAVKSAMLHLNKYIASFVNNSDFRINSVSPGGIYDWQPDGFVENYRAKTLGAGMLNPSDMNGSVIFLLSEASKYINGQNIIVDDGFAL